MPENNYFQGISSDFISHYFELLKNDIAKLENIYADNVKLTYDNEVTTGKSEVFKKISTFKNFVFDQDKFVAQPYLENGDILITSNAKLESKPVIVTFVLHEVDASTHRYGIVAQLIHINA